MARLPRPAPCALLVLLALAAAAALGSPPQASGTEPPSLVLTVNTTDNLDDGHCDHPILSPGNHCSFREAINSVNSGVGDGITFDTSLFETADPGVIHVEGGEGCLPAITKSVLIDATEAGVVIDGDTDDNGMMAPCVVALRASASMDGFHLRIRGGEKRLTIRQFPGSGIAVLGNNHRLGNVLFDRVEVHDVGNIGVSVTGATSAVSITVTGSVINTEEGGEDAGDGIGISLTGPLFADSTIGITGNEVRAAEDAVDLSLDGNIGDTIQPTITATITGNQELNGGQQFGEHAAKVTYCEGGGCTIHGGTITATISGNGQIIGDDHAVDVGIFANGSSTDATVNIDAIGNDNLISNRTAANINVLLCCGDGGNQANVRVNENGEVRGDAGGATVNMETCCGNGNANFVDVNENGEIDGGLGYGVNVDSLVGPVIAKGPGDSNDNTNRVEVRNNGEIRGGDDGVDIDTKTGANTGTANGNENRVTVSDNGPITGDEDGVKIDCDAGSTTGAADENRTEVHVDGNGDIRGDGGDGVDINEHAGSGSGPAHGNSGTATVRGNFGVLTGALAGARIGARVGSESADSDDNGAEVHVSDNGPITGGDEDGVTIEHSSGGVGGAGSGNRSTVEVRGNGDITGADDGVQLDHPTHAGGGGGVGRTAGAAGANVDTVSVIDNGTVRGDHGDGLHVSVCAYEAGDASAVRCLMDVVTILTVSGNDFDNSDESGISVCCGNFELAGTGKSAISNNAVTGNGDDGIELDSVSGANVGPGNVITGNGTDVHGAGIEVKNDTSFAIWQDSDAPGDVLCSMHALCDVGLSAAGNIIVGNSIADNVRLGIDLEGLDVPGGDYDDVSRVGCVSIVKALIDPNGCVAAPEITLVAAGDKVGGTACPGCVVDLYLADADPPDNAFGDVLGRQHGEGVAYLFVSGTADASGNFSVTLPCGLSTGEITATATQSASGTSEFSANRPFLGTAPCSPTTPAATRTATSPGPQPTSTRPAPTATAIATATATVPSPAKPCGDVNDDGSVDSIDASLVLQLTAGLIDELENPESADADGDGEITAIDASLVLQATAGLIAADDLGC